MREPLQVEEERRVHYIACTRARKRNTIYALKGKEGIFLQEMELPLTNPIGIGGTLEKEATSVADIYAESTKEMNDKLTDCSFDDSIPNV